MDPRAEDARNETEVGEDVSGRPLLGQRVLITRPRHQSATLRDALLELGADVKTQPAIEIVAPGSWEAVDDALERLRTHSWPGNDRELREQIRAAVRLARGDELGPEDLLLSWDASEDIPSFRDAKRQFEHEYVTRVLRICRGNISRAARIAKKDRKDFYDVMRRNSINPADFRH